MTPATSIGIIGRYLRGLFDSTNRFSHIPLTDFFSPTIDQVRKMIAEDFSECAEGEEVRILTGEGNVSIWNHDTVTAAIRSAIKKGVRIRCIVGPVMNGDKGYNFLVEQAVSANSCIQLYVGHRRELTHYRVYGERKLWVEKYHEPLASQDSRMGRYVISDGSDPMAVYTVRKFSRDFDAVIQVNGLTPIKSRDEILFLSSSELKSLSSEARLQKELFDDYDRRKIERLQGSTRLVVAND